MQKSLHAVAVFAVPVLQLYERRTLEAITRSIALEWSTEIVRPNEVPIIALVKIEPNGSYLGPKIDSR